MFIPRSIKVRSSTTGGDRSHNRLENKLNDLNISNSTYNVNDDDSTDRINLDNLIFWLSLSLSPFNVEYHKEVNNYLVNHDDC